jgi:hypothetical protein
MAKVHTPSSIVITVKDDAELRKIDDIKDVVNKFYYTAWLAILPLSLLIDWLSGHSKKALVIILGIFIVTNYGARALALLGMHETRHMILKRYGWNGKGCPSYSVAQKDDSKN